MKIERCPSVRPPPVVTRVARRWSPRPASAISIGPQCIVTTVAHVVASIPSGRSTNPKRGVPCVPRSCASTRCAGSAGRGGCWWPPAWSTTSVPSRRAAHVSMPPTCNRCACPATTQKPHARRRGVGHHPGRGVKSLASRSRDARASTNFCACKLKQGGLPPEDLNNMAGRKPRPPPSRRSRGRCRGAEPTCGNRNLKGIWSSRPST